MLWYFLHQSRQLQFCNGTEWSTDQRLCPSQTALLSSFTFTVAIWLAGFTKTVGLEMAQKGNITCNAICPGYVLTDLIRNQLEDTAKARGISKVCD